MVWFAVKDDKASATRNPWRTDRIPHDRRRTLRTRKRAESEHRPGGAVGNRVQSRHGGLARADAAASGIRQGGLGMSAASATFKEPSSVRKSMLPKAKWLQGSSAHSPSGADSPHTWHCSPHPSGSSEQRQKARPPHMAENAMKPAATSAAKFLNLYFALMAAYYSTNSLRSLRRSARSSRRAQGVRAARGRG